MISNPSTNTVIVIITIIIKRAHGANMLRHGLKLKIVSALTIFAYFTVIKAASVYAA